MKKLGWSIAFIAFIFILLVCYVFFVDDPKNLYNAISSAKILPILAAALCMVFYWLFESLAQASIMKSGGCRLKFRQVFRVTMIGQLFNCITPSATGGQPVQTYQMTRYGLSAGESMCMLLVRFLVYQAVMVAYSLVVLVLKLSYFNRTISAFSSLALIGFAVNMGALAMLVLACFFPKICAKGANAVIRFLGKIKIIKNVERKTKRVDEEIAKFHESFRFFRGNLRVTIIPALFSLLQLTVFFAIPYFICKSLAVPVAFDIAFSAAALTFMISSFVPLPGGSGGAEGAFWLFFGSAFAAAGKSVAVAILLWRLLTFYLPIVTGSFFMLGNKNMVKYYVETTEKKRDAKPDSDGSASA